MPALILLNTVRGIAVDGSRVTPGPRPRPSTRPDMTGAVDHRVVLVPEGLAGERVDIALARMFGLSRSRAAELVAAGHVHVDGVEVAKSHRVTPGTMLDVAIPSRGRPARGHARDRRGDPHHPRRRLDRGRRQAGRGRRPSLAGLDRADRGGPSRGGRASGSPPVAPPSGRASSSASTSARPGVMVITKSEHGYSILKNAFRHRTVDKTYHALVQGHPDPHEGTVDAPIGRHPGADYKFAVLADGRSSVTHYETLEAHRFASLLEVQLETGRTHQIRVHMAALQHPCVGDLTYGADPALPKRVGLQRQWLHAVRLGFVHPDSGEYVEFESPYPDDLARALEIDPRCPLSALLRPAVDGDAERAGRRSTWPPAAGGGDAAGHPHRRRGARLAGRPAAQRRRGLGRRGAGRGGGVRPDHRRPGSTTCTSPRRTPARVSARRCSTWSRRAARTGSACGSSR